MDDIIAAEVNLNSPVDRNPQFVGGGDVFAVAVGVGILKLPPPLMPHGGNFQGISPPRRLIQVKQGDDRPDAQAQDEDGGNDRPGDFQGGMAVGLRRQFILPGPAAELDDGVNQDAFHQDENGDHHPEQDVEQEQLLFGDRPGGAESGLLGVRGARQQQE